ncbi:MAG: hypothetical protein ACOVQA_05375 [Thermoflexibacteraceae bacterium]
MGTLKNQIQKGKPKKNLVDKNKKQKDPLDNLNRAYRVLFGTGFTTIILLLLSLTFEWTTFTWIAGTLIVLVLLILFDVIGYIERLFSK